MRHASLHLPFWRAEVAPRTQRTRFWLRTRQDAGKLSEAEALLREATAGRRALLGD